MIDYGNPMMINDSWIFMIISDWDWFVTLIINRYMHKIEKNIATILDSPWKLYSASQGILPSPCGDHGRFHSNMDSHGLLIFGWTTRLFLIVDSRKISWLTSILQLRQPKLQHSPPKRMDSSEQCIIYLVFLIMSIQNATIIHNSGAWLVES